MALNLIEIHYIFVILQLEVAIRKLASAQQSTVCLAMLQARVAIPRGTSAIIIECTHRISYRQRPDDMVIDERAGYTESPWDSAWQFAVHIVRVP